MRFCLQISILVLIPAFFLGSSAEAAFSLSSSQHQPYSALQQNGVDMGPLSTQYPGYDPYTTRPYQNFNSSLYPTNYNPSNASSGYPYTTSMPQHPSQAAANTARMPGGNLRTVSGRLNIFVDLFNIFTGKANAFESLLGILSQTIGSRFTSGLKNIRYTSTTNRLTELEAYAQTTAASGQAQQTIDPFWRWCESCAQSPASQNRNDTGEIFNWMPAGTPVRQNP